MTYEERKDIDMLNSRICSILLDRQDDIIRMAKKVGNEDLLLAADEAVSYMQEAYDVLKECIRHIPIENVEQREELALQDPERDIQIEVVSEGCEDDYAPRYDDFGMGY